MAIIYLFQEAEHVNSGSNVATPRTILLLVDNTTLLVVIQSTPSVQTPRALGAKGASRFPSVSTSPHFRIETLQGFVENGRFWETT